MNNRISVLIPKQLPEFVREEYPLFITFLEAYYEFLENKQNTQKNDLITQRENLLELFDVDKYVDEFTSQYFNTFARNIPTNVAVNKEFLIKNILPLYQAKGSEKSFELLFKFLYGVDVKLEYPKNNILIASDGKWTVETSLKISTDISSTYIADGLTNTYTILPPAEINIPRTLSVYINDVLQVENYIILKEYNVIVFDTIIPENHSIRIEYDSNIDLSIFINRKIVGLISGASAISERILTTTLNNKIIYEFFVDKKTLVGEFNTGELLNCPIIVNDILINVLFKTISEIKSIKIINGGSGYNITDKVIIEAPYSDIPPRAIISKVSSGQISSVIPIETGCGFEPGGRISINGLEYPLVDIMITSVSTNPIDTIIAPNTFSISSVVISDIDIENIIISDVDYGFATTANANTKIFDTFSDIEFNDLGQITALVVNYVNLIVNENPIVDAESAKIIIENTGFTTANTTLHIKQFGSLGKLEIANSGINYNIGDDIEFNNISGGIGEGAFAEIIDVDGNGGITNIEFVPGKITGTANISSSSITVTGNDTAFNTELAIGKTIRINGEIKTVVDISSNNSLNVNSEFSSTANNKSIRLYGTYLLGGSGYEQNLLPTANIISSTGSSGNVVVKAIFGDGETFRIIESGSVFGQIQEITVVEHGKSITSIPKIDLSKGGNGDAIVEPIFDSSYTVYPGKWKNFDGIISSSSIKLQDKDFYHIHSYVVSSVIEFSKYKQIIKELLHPAGLRVYGKCNRIEEIDNDTLLDVETIITIN